MSTNPVGKGTVNLTFNAPESLRADIEELAKASGLTPSAYMRAVLGDAAQKRRLALIGVTIKTPMKIGESLVHKRRKADRAKEKE